MKKDNKTNNKKNKILFIITVIIILIVIMGPFVIRKLNNQKDINNSDILDNITKMEVFFGNSSVSIEYEIYSNGRLNYKYFNCGKKVDGDTELSKEEFKNVLNLIEKYNVLSWYNNSKHLANEKDVLQMDGRDSRHINFEFNEKVNVKTNDEYNPKDVEDFFTYLIEFVNSKTHYDVYNLG